MKKLIIPIIILFLTSFTSCSASNNDKSYNLPTTQVNSTSKTIESTPSLPIISTNDETSLYDENFYNNLLTACQNVLENQSQYAASYEVPYRYSILKNVEVDIISGSTIKVVDNQYLYIIPTHNEDNVTIRFTSIVGNAIYSDIVEFSTCLNSKIVTTPQVGVNYNIILNCVTFNTTFYFTGEKDKYYGTTSYLLSDATTVILEEAIDGYYISYKDKSGNKMYYNLIYENGYVNFNLSDTPSTTWYWDNDYYTFKTTINDKEYFTGCRMSFTNIGSLSIDYLGSVYNVYLVEK